MVEDFVPDGRDVTRGSVFAAALTRDAEETARE